MVPQSTSKATRRQWAPTGAGPPHTAQPPTQASRVAEAKRGEQCREGGLFRGGRGGRGVVAGGLGTTNHRAKGQGDQTTCQQDSSHRSVPFKVLWQRTKPSFYFSRKSVAMTRRQGGYTPRGGGALDPARRPAAQLARPCNRCYLVDPSRPLSIPALHRMTQTKPRVAVRADGRLSCATASQKQCRCRLQIVVCHCFAEAVPTTRRCTTSAKQWHTTLPRSIGTRRVCEAVAHGEKMHQL